MAPSPVVALNRAVAVAEVEGPAAALALVDALLPTSTTITCSTRSAPTCSGAWAATDEAALAYEAAIARTDNARERDFLRTQPSGAHWGVRLPEAGNLWDDGGASLPATAAIGCRAHGESLMKSVVSSCLIASAAIVVVAASVPEQQQTPFRSGSKTVAVYGTVTDREGRMVPNLTREDFEIRDNGKPQPITVFSNEVQPITVVMMLDRSGSMRGNFGLVVAAAEAFVRRLEPGDKARIGTFAERVQIEPEHFTSDREEMIRILRSSLQPVGPTPLWNAVDEAITSLREQEGRRVVLVFSDGADAPMNFKFNNRSIMDVMRRAQQENVMVYAIGLQSTMLRSTGGRSGGGGLSAGALTSQRPDPGLAIIAEDTGGGYFEMNRAENLESTFAGVADELHRQYALGFEPPKLDDRMHKLEVKIGKPGMKARVRKEYFAAAEKSKP